MREYQVNVDINIEGDNAVKQAEQDLRDLIAAEEDARKSANLLSKGNENLAESSDEYSNSLNKETRAVRASTEEGNRRTTSNRTATQTNASLGSSTAALNTSTVLLTTSRTADITATTASIAADRGLTGARASQSEATSNLAANTVILSEAERNAYNQSLKTIESAEQRLKLYEETGEIYSLYGEELGRSNAQIAADLRTQIDLERKINKQRTEGVNISEAGTEAVTETGKTGNVVTRLLTRGWAQFNAVISANPLGVVLAAILAIYGLFKDFQPVIDVINWSFNVMKNTVSAIWDVLTSFDFSGFKTIISDATALNKLKKEQIKLEGELTLIQAQSEKQIEKLKSLRDDESKSLSSRIAANNELTIVLEEQLSKEVQLAKVKEDIAALELKKNKGNLELQKAYNEALAETAKAEAKFYQQSTEQITNNNNLLKERAEIIKSMADTDQAIADIEYQRNLRQIETEREKFKITADYNEEKYANTLAFINKELVATEKDTKRYAELIDARRLLNAQFQDDQVQNIEAFQEWKLEQYEEEHKAIVKIGKDTTAANKAALIQQVEDRVAYNEAVYAIIQEERAAELERIEDMMEYTAGLLDSVTESYLGSMLLMIREFGTLTEEQVGEKVQAIGQIVSMALSSVASLLNTIANNQDTSNREGFEKQKKLRINSTMIDANASAVAGMLAGLSAGGPWGIALGAITAAASLAYGIYQVGQIRKQTFDGGGSASGGGASLPKLTATSSIIQPRDGNSETLKNIEAGVNVPTRAYTIGNDVTTQQGIDRQTQMNGNF